MPAATNSWIDVTAEKFNYSLEHFVIPKHYENDLQSVMIPNGLVMDRIEKLARMIVDDTRGQQPLVVCCVLKGGHQFFADLVNFMKKCVTKQGSNVPLSLEFIKVKSYENDQSTGNVKISLTDEELAEFKGRDLLIVEDIIDTGRTMVRLLDRLKAFEPASVRVTSLLLKKTPLSCGYIPDYVGFAIPDAFVVGYALDYNEHFRDLDHICVINDTGKAKYAVKEA
ncbi:hypothetical protein IWQ60_001053 [Tieghemiomyces parasiticus]|uniref:Hypoxanthine phosphoribosyltransferase n=1 Tax=Tieghemiomyces parasiticus TaxID=78921 RepID=A0A9W8ALQ4_9FUNG|nr:hypothetical protein IWQ60_001053 [Tieghemiomyces parasiticus]